MSGDAAPVIHVSAVVVRLMTGALREAADELVSTDPLPTPGTFGHPDHNRQIGEFGGVAESAQDVLLQGLAQLADDLEVIHLRLTTTDEGLAAAVRHGVRRR